MACVISTQYARKWLKDNRQMHDVSNTVKSLEVVKTTSKLEEGELFGARKILEQWGVSVEYVADEVRAISVLEELATATFILGCDIETAPLPQYAADERAGLNPHKSRIRLLQVATPTQVYVFDLNAVDIWILWPLWSNPLVFHNAVFDVKFLRQAEVFLYRVGCTLLQDLVIRGGGNARSLADLAKEKLGVTIPKEEQLSDWSVATLSKEQIDYAALDAAAALKLCGVFMDELKASGQLEAAKIYQGAIQAIAAIELEGLPFDAELHRSFVAKWQQEKKLLTARLVAETGVNDLDKRGAIAAWFKGYAKDKGYSLPMGKNGFSRVGKDVLAPYRDDPIIGDYLHYSELKSHLSTFGVSLADKVDSVTGRIHPSVFPCRAATGRFGIHNPNSQNFPRGAFKRVFAPKDGRALVVADYSQIELRIAAIIAKEKTMLEAYRNGEDLHRLTASKILGVKPAEVTKDQRTCAKAVNFGFIYGQRERGFMAYAKGSYGVDVSYEEARSYRKSFFEGYPGLGLWHQGIERMLRKEGVISTKNGWKRDFKNQAEKFVKDQGQLITKLRKQIARVNSQILKPEAIIKECNGKLQEMFIDSPKLVARRDEQLEKLVRLRNKQAQLSKELQDAKVTLAKTKQCNFIDIPRHLGKASFLNAAFNTPVQGAGAELIAIALKKVELAIRDSSTQLINVVHDEIVVECDEKEASKIREILKKAMQDAFEEMFPEHTYMLHDIVEAKVGENWSEAK